MKITAEIATKVRDLVAAGLVSGKGRPVPGEMCVEAAVCHALGLPHGAAMFDRMANNDEDAALRALSQKQRRWNEARAVSTRACAAIVRDTEIVPPSSKED